MSLARRFHMFFRVAPVLAALALLKAGLHVLGYEFMPLDGLIPSLIGGSIFLIGFLLSQVLTDYREAERVPAEIRTVLQAIHDDVVHLARKTPEVDAGAFRAAIAAIIRSFDEGLGVEHKHRDLAAAIAHVDALSELFGRLQDLDVSDRYIVRLMGLQDTLRRLILRVAYIQKMEFIPSAHVLVQTLVGASLFVLLFLKTAETWESMLILIVVGYMFVYSLMLIGHLDEPFRVGEGSVDDVSLFQLRDFLAALEAEATGETGHARPKAATRPRPVAAG